jgi:FlaA1/EpsC-like NDP-sugar epimerase
MLVLADVVGLTLAFLVAHLLFGTANAHTGIGATGELLVFCCSLPGWIVIARLYSLYDADEERTHHPTTDDIVGVFHLVTIGTWTFFGFLWLMTDTQPNLARVMTLWALAIVLVTTARSAARAYCRAQPSYLQRTIILGAGEVGQRAARKLLRHPEYRLELLGLVDARPKPRHEELDDLPLLGESSELAEIVRQYGVERSLVAFSSDSAQE